jgi:cell wall assembly regulator SMI1
MMKETLGELSKTLIASQSPLTNFFKAGLTAEAVDRLTKNVNLNLPQDLKTIYEWKNGVDLDKLDDRNFDTSLFPLATFVGLEDALEAYQFYTNEKYWPTNMFPVFQSNGGDFFLSDINPQSKNYSRIYFFSPSDPYFSDLISYADSVEKLLESVINCYSLGIFRYDQTDEYLDFDFDKQVVLFRKINPESEYWKISY